MHRPQFAADGSVTCACGTPGCANAGKHPAFLWSNLTAGEKAYVDDETQNVGIATGERSDVFVVDLDIKPSQGIDGLARLKELVAAHNEPWPNTLTVRTPSGGWHMYFRWPGFQVSNSASKLAPGVDIRGDGGYTVLFGSVHKSGGRYELFGIPDSIRDSDEFDPDSLVASAPTWLLARVARSAGADTAPFPVPMPGGDAPTGRTATTSLEGWKVIERAANGIRKLEPGSRNERLFLIAAQLGDWSHGGDINLSDAKHVLYTTVQTLGWDDLPKTFQTIDNGLEKGAATKHRVCIIGPRHEAVNNDAIEALADRDDVYVIGNRLARDTGAEITVMSAASLEEILTACVDWRQKSKEGELKFAHIPPWAAPGIYNRGHWPNLRVIDGYSDVPILRRDGSICTERGYDGTTRTVLSRSWEDQGNCTKEDAVLILRDLLVDFPFQHTGYLAAAIAAMLTPLALHAFDGPSPLFFFEASLPGSGKSKLANVCAKVSTLKAAQLMAYVDNDDNEMRKAITGQCRAPTPLVLMDNIPKRAAFGGAGLCAALTSPDRVWADRLLGRNEIFKGKISWAWYATGNNCTLGPDMGRRVCRVRLVPKTSNPEARTNFRHPELESWVEANKEGYMWACLSLLRGYVLAGKPRGTGIPWSGHVEWDAIIAGCVEWAGFGNLDTVRITSEEDDGSADILLGFREMWKVTGDITSRDAWGVLYEGPMGAPAHGKTLRRALDGMYPRGCSAKDLALALRSITDIYFDGCCVTAAGKRGKGNVAMWTVV